MARQLLVEEDVFEVRESELDIPGPDMDVVYYLRPITSAMARKVMQKHTKFSRRNGETRDDMAIHDEMLDYTIAKWDGMNYRGSDAPCTLENKKRLPPPIQGAIIDRAQMGSDSKPDDDQEDKEDSFRKPA